MSQRFFKIHSRSIFNPEWGDYGDMLQNGMSMHRPRVNGRIALERTGPFIPQVTIPFAVLLTSEAKTSLESSGLSGFEFIPVEKAHIVELPWETWNLQAEQPAEYPESGEPEDYILTRPHDPAIATFLGDVWELESTSRVRILRPEMAVDTSTWNGDDVFRGEGFDSLLFSNRAREWFSEKWPSLVSFDQFPVQ
jgi:hypothetical protein